MDGRISLLTATIASSGTTSDAVNLITRPGSRISSATRSPSRVIRLEMPAAWTAATIAIQVQSVADGTWRTLADSAGGDVAISTAADKATYLAPEVVLALHGAYAIRLVSSASQGAEREITVVTEGLA